MSGKYDDIINMEHPTSLKHPRMSRIDRAAQFSPFAALSGYEDAVEETARVTDEKRTLTDDEIDSINKKLNVILEHLRESPRVRIRYFVPDKRKDGGEYVTVTGTVKRIDEFESVILMSDGTLIPLADIRDIEGKIL